MGVALVAGCLGGVAPAWAQTGPAPTGPAPNAEPMPFAPSAAPMVPHPHAYPGPQLPAPFNDLYLPDYIPNASSRPLPPDEGIYAGAGFQSWRRQGLGHRPLAVLNPQNTDTGIRPRPRQVQVVFDQDDFDPPLVFGFRGTLGYYWGDYALEWSGYYLPEHSSSVEVRRPGRLDSFFINPPLGFEGDNGLWTQADLMRLQVESRLANVELNLRKRPAEQTAILNWLCGIRYLDYEETVGIFTDDEGLTVRDLDGFPDPRRSATYSVNTRTKLLAPQLGLDWNWELCHWLTIGAVAKGAWGVNFADVSVQLQRGDGLIGREGSRGQNMFSHLYELGFWFDWHPWECLHFRGGYNLMWLLHVPMASDQINFNLAQPLGTRDDNGNIFFRGPMGEMQLIFVF
jgi:hypothetical protein